MSRCASLRARSVHCCCSRCRLRKLCKCRVRCRVGRVSDYCSLYSLVAASHVLQPNCTLVTTNTASASNSLTTAPISQLINKSSTSSQQQVNAAVATRQAQMQAVLSQILQALIATLISQLSP